MRNAHDTGESKMTTQEKLDECVRMMELLTDLAKNGQWEYVAELLEAPNGGWQQALTDATQERA